MQTRRDAAASKVAGFSQGGTSSALTESGKNPVRIPVPAVDEREQQATTPDVSFHTMMQDMQQRIDSMATAIEILHVELNNSLQASQFPSSWSQAKKSSSGRSKAVKKNKKQKKKSYNTASDDEDEEEVDKSTGSSTKKDATSMSIMENSTLRALYLADGSAMLPVATSDPRLTDQVDYSRYRLRKRKAVLCYASRRMKPLSISWAEGFAIISCGKVD
jgi:aspartyl-tRNA synthetase